MTENSNPLESVIGYFTRLKSRERWIVLVGAGVALFFVIFFSLFLSHRGPQGKATKTEQIAEQRGEFFQAAQEYAKLKQVVDLVDSRVAQRPPDFDLYSKINELVAAGALQQFVVKMDPGAVEGKEFLDEEYVDLNVQKIELRVLVNFLKQLEQLPGFVRISQMSIKTRLDNSKTLDVVLRISAYKEKAK